jgi:hypothetical protein
VTARGVFGLPQGQRSGAASAAMLGVPFADLDVSGASGPPLSAVYNGLMTANTYVELVPANTWTVPMVITQIDYLNYNLSATSVDVLEIGVGAAGSEISASPITRLEANAGLTITGTETQLVFPYGVYVPANTRVAWRHSSGGTWLFAVSALPVAAGRTRRVGFVGAPQAGPFTAADGAWTEVAATPPVAGGCWIIGFGYVEISAFKLGFGASGSEVPWTSKELGKNASNVAGSTRRYGSWQNGSTKPQWTNPVWWPAGTRLSVQNTSGATVNNAYMRLYVKEFLP